MYDVVIIGGGPAGLSAALYLARADTRVLVLDAGAPRHAAADAIHSLLTHDGRPPMAFRGLAHTDLARYDTQVERRDARVVSVDGENDGFRVQTADGQTFDTRRVLLATGVVDRFPAIPGVAEAWAVSVHHCPWCWGFEGRGQRMGLLIEDVLAARVAVALGRLTREVHGFWHADGPAPDSLRELFVRRGFVLHEGRVRSLDLDGQQLRAVQLDDRVVPLDQLYVHPHQEQVPIVRGLGLALDPQGSVQVDERFRTSVPGISAAGDLVTRMRQHVLHAMAMGADAGVGLVFDLSGPEDLAALSATPKG